MTTDRSTNHRLLVIDDNRAIHDDFRKILGEADPLAAAEARLFGKPEATAFEIDVALQGAEGLSLVQQANRDGRPYAMAFVDVRMPPGWDGVETTRRLWEADPDLQIVICTAHSDYSWNELTDVLGQPDRLLILKKPFDSIEVVQLAHALTDKWRLLQASKRTVADLEQRVLDRTRELDVANGRLQAVLDAATQLSIIATDTSGLVTVFNSGAERMLGYDAAEMIGLRTPEVLHDPAECLARSRELTAERGTPIQGFEIFVADARTHPFVQREWTYVRKDGSTLDVSLVITAKRDRDGAIRGFLGIATDITERKRLETALRVNNEHLAEQTRLAEDANRAKSEFLATMSHEIRTPMNGVVGMTELLLQTALNHEQRDYAERVLTSADSLLTVINDILDFSKVESGKLELETRDFVLRTAVEEAVDLLAERAQSKGLEMACLIDDAVPVAVQGDAGRLRQIVTNLLANAVKFTERGEVVLRVTVADESSGGVTLRFEVADTGIGISAAGQARLFQSFSQADASTTRRFGGTGLGLAIAKRLAELMGGTIGVASEPGQGSTFWFTVKLGTAPATPSVASALREDLHGLSVLAVDDNPTNLHVVRAHTRAWGMACECSTGGPDALRMIAAAAAAGRPYDVALLDLQMPGMDGQELAVAIRRDPANAAMKLVLMTSIAGRGLADRSEQAGIDASLTKPVRQSQLHECLRTVLGPSAARPSDAIRQSSTPAREPVRPGAAAPPRRRVLVAEDNRTNQFAAVHMLEKLGYHATVVVTGREAVDASRAGGYGLVLMDNQMPEMDGFTAAREIRTFERSCGRRPVPIVAVTANAMPGDREQCLAAGMDDYLAKPFKVAQLAEMLGRWFDPSLPAGHAPDAVPPVLPRSAIDARVLDQFRELSPNDGGDAFVRTIVDQYLGESTSLMATLQDAVAHGDAATLRSAAHRLKGSSGTVGATGMTELSAALEAVARQTTPEGASALVAALADELTRVRCELRSEPELAA